MKPKPPISDEDRELFRQAVKGIKPLSHKTKIQDTADSSNLTTVRPQQPPATQLPQTPLEANPETVSQEEYLEFVRSGIQQRAMRRLRQGRFPKNKVLDLHQLTATQAQTALENFIRECRQQHCRYALVIHGKGYRSASSVPVLKNKINLWLREYAEVLAFCTAKPNDGGAGAVYILLKG